MKIISLYTSLGLSLCFFGTSISNPPDSQQQAAQAEKKANKRAIALEHFDITSVMRGPDFLSDEERQSYDPLALLPDDIRPSFLFLERFINRVVHDEKKPTNEKECIVYCAEKFLVPWLTYEKAQKLLQDTDFMGMKHSLPYKALIYYMLSSYLAYTGHDKEEQWYSFLAKVSWDMRAYLNKYAWLFYNTSMVKIVGEKIKFGVTLSELKHYGKFPPVTAEKCNLEDCNIGSIEDLPMHVSAQTLKILYLQNNTIPIVPASACVGMHHVRSLSLGHSGVKYLEPGCFNDLHALEHLYLSYNHLEKITDVMMPLLRKKKSLVNLEIHKNQLSYEEQKKLVQAIMKLCPHLLTATNKAPAPYNHTVRLELDPEDNTALKTKLCLQVMLEDYLKARETEPIVS